MKKGKEMLLKVLSKFRFDYPFKFYRVEVIGKKANLLR